MPDEFDYKSLSLEQLKWAYEGTHFKREPFWHQFVSLAFAQDKKRVCFWHGVGSGKTLAAYYAAMMKGCQNILVVCPKHSVSSWLRDIKWTDYTHLLISGETLERKAKMARSVNVHIIPYFALKTVFTSLKRLPGTTLVATGLTEVEAQKKLEENDELQVIKSRTAPGTYNIVKPKGRKWTIDPDELNRYGFDCLILDEVHKCNSATSTQAKICKGISERVQNVIALTGTPVDKILLEMFHIYHVVDLGATFGTNWWRFRLDHFEEHGLDYEIRKGHREIILHQAMPITLSFSKEECTDLPECVEDTLHLEPTEEYRKLERRIIMEKSIGVARSKATFPLGSVRSQKLKQLSGGFIYLPDETTYRLKENPKLEAILDLLTSNGEKMIVWYPFKEEGDMLAESFRELGVPFIEIRGGMTDEEVIEAQRQFQEDPYIRAAFCQESCNEGWDGFAAGITVFTHPIISPRIREQCIGRMVRTGQEKRTIVYDLILEHTVDDKARLNHGTRQKEIDIYMGYMQNYAARMKG